MLSNAALDSAAERAPRFDRRCRGPAPGLKASRPGKAAEILHATNWGPRWARRNDEMHNAYIIEIDEEAVGIAAREARGFRFHAALHAFNGLDGRLFPSVKDATRAARALTAAENHGAGADVGGSPRFEGRGRL